MNKQPRIIEQVCFENNDIHFVRGLNLNFEQQHFPQANGKVEEMLRNPITSCIRIR